MPKLSVNYTKLCGKERTVQNKVVEPLLELMREQYVVTNRGRQYPTPLYQL